MNQAEGGARQAPRSPLASILDDTLAELATLAPVERALLLKQWAEAIPSLSKTIAEYHTEAVWQAAQQQTGAEVAAALGVSASVVANRVGEYLKAHPGAPRKPTRMPKTPPALRPENAPRP